MLTTWSSAVVTHCMVCHTPLTCLKSANKTSDSSCPNTPLPKFQFRSKLKNTHKNGLRINRKWVNPHISMWSSWPDLWIHRYTALRWHFTLTIPWYCKMEALTCTKMVKWVFICSFTSFWLLPTFTEIYAKSGRNIFRFFSFLQGKNSPEILQKHSSKTLW